MDIGKDLTKRQQEIFDFIKKYSARYGYPPTVRDIGKAVGLASSSTVHAHLANLEKVGLLRRDPIEAARDRAARQGGRRRQERRDRQQRAAARRPGRGRPADPRRGEHRGLRAGARRSPAGEEGEFVLARARRLDDRRRHPRRRLRRRAQPGHGGRRRDRRRARGRGGDRQALLQGVRPHPPAAGERDDGTDPHARRAASWAAWSECSGRWTSDGGALAGARCRTWTCSCGARTAAERLWTISCPGPGRA